MVVGRQDAIPVRSSVLAALVTSVARSGPAEVELDQAVGLDHPSVVNCDEIYTIPKHALVRKRGELRFEEMLLVDAALRTALDL